MPHRRSRYAIDRVWARDGSVAYRRGRNETVRGPERSRGRPRLVKDVSLHLAECQRELEDVQVVGWGAQGAGRQWLRAGLMECALLPPGSPSVPRPALSWQAWHGSVPWRCCLLQRQGREKQQALDAAKEYEQTCRQAERAAAQDLKVWASEARRLGAAYSQQRAIRGAVQLAPQPQVPMIEWLPRATTHISLPNRHHPSHPSLPQAANEAKVRSQSQLNAVASQRPAEAEAAGVSDAGAVLGGFFGVQPLGLGPESLSPSSTVFRHALSTSDRSLLGYSAPPCLTQTVSSSAPARPAAKRVAELGQQVLEGQGRVAEAEVALQQAQTERQRAEARLQAAANAPKVRGL